MFKRQTKRYKVSFPHALQDDYNETVYDYSESALIHLAIDLDSSNHYTGNDADIQNATYSALTKDKRIKKDCIVDNRFLVTSVEDYKRYRIAHLKEIDNGGWVRDNC